MTESHLQSVPRIGSASLTARDLHMMFDELRKVGPGLYLGIGRAGFTKQQRDLLGPFILEGPVAEFFAEQ